MLDPVEEEISLRKCFFPFCQVTASWVGKRAWIKLVIHWKQPYLLHKRNSAKLKFLLGYEIDTCTHHTHTPAWIFSVWKCPCSQHPDQGTGHYWNPRGHCQLPCIFEGNYSHDFLTPRRTLACFWTNINGVIDHLLFFLLTLSLNIMFARWIHDVHYFSLLHRTYLFKVL